MMNLFESLGYSHNYVHVSSLAKKLVFSPSTRRRNTNKYISEALDPSISDLHEAERAVHVQLKPSDKKTTTTTNQRHQENPGMGG